MKKVKLTLVFEIPDEYADDGLPKAEPLTPSGTPWKLSFIRQAIFDNFTNYAVINHFSNALTWTAKKPEADAPKWQTDVHKKIVENHQNWANIIQSACETVEVEILN